jgi:hypothetical protein
MVAGQHLTDRIGVSRGSIGIQLGRALNRSCDLIPPGASHRLNSLEPLKLRVLKVERLVITSLLVCGSERLRFGPSFKGGTVLPHSV